MCQVLLLLGAWSLELCPAQPCRTWGKLYLTLTNGQATECIHFSLTVASRSLDPRSQSLYSKLPLHSERYCDHGSSLVKLFTPRSHVALGINNLTPYLFLRVDIRIGTGSSFHIVNIALDLYCVKG